MVNSDIYQDQIMTSPGRNWTSELINSLASKLSSSQWQTLFKSRDLATFLKKNSNTRLDLCLVHNNQYLLDLPGLLITDVIYQDSKNKTIINLYPEIFYVYGVEFEYDNNILPEVNFNCFINRGCGFRQSWMYQFQRHGLLDQGYISYWCENREDQSMPPTEHFESLLQGNEIFIEEHNKLKSHIPYKNFNCSLEQAILKSNLSLVIETFFDDEGLCFSEKTWRALQMPRPFIIFGRHNSIEYLKSWGFDIYDDIIDHSYDQETNAIARQMMILQQLSTPLQYTPEALESFERRAKHNRNRLRDFKCQWPLKFNAALDFINTY